MSTGRAARLAVGCLAATLALFAAAAAVSATHFAFSLTDTLDAGSYAALMTGMGVIGILIVRREPRNPVGWLFCTTPLLVAMSVGAGPLAILAGPRHHDLPGAVVPAWLSLWGWASGLLSFLLLIPLLFPDGRPPAGRWRILLRLDLVVLAAVVLDLATQPGDMYPGIPNPLGLGIARSVPAIAAIVVAVVVLIAAGIVSAVVRYRRAGRTARVQMREVLFATCLTVAGFVAISVLDASETLYTVDYALIPGAVGLAMLRYRLYDVDVVIRRTLVYAALVATLAAVYLAGVAGLGAGLRAVTGLSSSLAVTLSTLAVVGVFQPLRGRIQRAVDRRFYRTAYDARATVEAFSGQLREQIDLDVLADRLLVTVRDTVRPRSASVWLAPVTIPERPSGTTEA
jgi:hypothetical protein